VTRRIGTDTKTKVRHREDPHDEPRSREVPVAVPGIVFLSGGQHVRLATAHLNTIDQLPIRKPWKVSPALDVWQGGDENFAVGQGAFYRRARLNAAASVGASPSDEDPPHRHDWRDD
jgi:fructose-bisphosphate aldolase class 1